MADCRIAPGARVGHLHVQHEIGTGAFGTVFLARDTLIDRLVAVKVVREPSYGAGSAELSRALSEAKLVGSLRSPNVVALHHVHALGQGEWLLEMEFVDGGSLENLLGDDLRLPAASAVRIAIGVLAGLVDAHERGIRHGDVKPGNVLLTKDGSVKLADFGLARVLRDSVAADAEAVMAGTPHYIAPEVILGDPPVLASDVWSVGVLLYRMVAGRLPFDAPDMGRLFLAIENEAPPGLPVDVPTGLSRLIVACLAKRPTDRPSSAALLDSLGRATSSGSEGTAPSSGAATNPTIAGRRSELATLDAAIEGAVRQQGRAVLVTGPTGSGKTALVDAVLESARRRGLRVLQASVSPEHGVVRPIVQALSSAGAEDQLSAHGVENLEGAKLASLLRQVAEGRPTSDVASRAQVLWMIRSALESLGRERTTLLALEDLHGGTASDVAVVRDVVSRLSGVRACVIVTCRTASEGGTVADSGFLGPLAEVEGLGRVDLAPLRGEAIYEILEQRSGSRVAPEVAGHVVEKSHGNPLFALELLRHLAECNATVVAGGEVVPGPAWETQTTPRRLRDLLAQRMGRLAEPARTLLDVASVDGFEFDSSAVASILGRPLVAVLQQLQRLCRREGIVRAQTQGFRFDHPLLWQVLYEDVAPELRRLYHRRLAEHLEAAGSSDAQRIGVHWERAGETARAAPYLRQAATRAAQRHETLRTIDLCRRAGLVLGKADTAAVLQDPELVIRLAVALALANAPAPEVEGWYDLLIAAAERAGLSRIRLSALTRRAHYRFFRRGLSSDEVAEVETAARTLPVSPDLGRAHYLLGVVSKVRGDLDEAARRLHAADEVFASVGGQDFHRAAVLDQMGSIRLRQGRLREARTLFQDAATLAARSGQVGNAAVSQVNAALAAIGEGDVDGQEAVVLAAIRTLRLDRATNQAAHATAVLARIRTASGDFAGADAAVTDALRSLAPADFLPARIEAQTEAGYLAVLRGQPAAAEAALEEARAAATKQGDAEALSRAWAIEAQRLCLTQDPAGAREAALASVRALEGSSNVNAKCLIASMLAEALIYGLPDDVRPRVEALLPEAAAQDLTRLPRALLAAGPAHEGADTTAEALRAAATALREHPGADRRAVSELLADRLSAEVARRAGRLEEAQAIEEGVRTTCATTGVPGLWTLMDPARGTRPAAR